MEGLVDGICKHGWYVPFPEQSVCEAIHTLNYQGDAVLTCNSLMAASLAASRTSSLFTANHSAARSLADC